MAMRRDQAAAFSQPVRQIVFMLATLAAVGAVGGFLYAPIQTVFEANVYLNGLIVAVFAIGVLAIFVAMGRLSASVSWIESFAADRAGHEFAQPPQLMASLSALLRDSRARTALSATSTRSILDSVATRLDETRDITRYLGNLLIFLGLLGTFWGLSNTVPAVVDTIRSLAPAEGDGGGGLVFDRLMAGLEDQLGGMGTAFASSLLGLAGSMVVGLLDLFLGHAQNRFFRELEEWLSSITRVSVAEGGDGALTAALIEQNALQIEALGGLLQASEGKREAFEARIAELTDSVSRLTGALGAAEPGQGAATVAALERIAARLEARGAEGEAAVGDDVEVRARLRNIDRQLVRLLDEIAAGRQDMIADLRIELRAVAQALAERR
jgi:hypothetical protein